MSFKYKAPRVINPRSGSWALYMEENSDISNAEMMGTSFIGFGAGFRSGLIRSYCEIGRYTRIGRNVSIGLGVHDYRNTSIAPFFNFPPTGQGRGVASVDPKRRVIIGNDCWVGDGVRINSGVTIGDGAIIGASALVTQDVEPYSIVVGLPAKHLKWRFPEEIRSELMKHMWWQYDPEYLLETMSPDPATTIAQLEATKHEAPVFSRPQRRITPDTLKR